MNVDALPDWVVSLDGVSFAFPNGLRAIGDASLEVGRGEIVSIVGPSGCGKTTLLRILAGLERPSSGAARRNVPPDRHPCTMVFQDNTVLPWLRVRDNVALHYRLTGGRNAGVRDHVERLLEMVNLSEFADFYPAKLSGGMRRRVAVLTAIAPSPGLLLLDEPFSALDEPTRIAVHADVYRLVREFGMTVILVTHDLAEAITLSDRVLLLCRAPSRVVSEYQIPFGTGDRDMFELRAMDEYLDLYGTLWGDLKDQIVNAGSAP